MKMMKTNPFSWWGCVLTIEAVEGVQRPGYIE